MTMQVAETNERWFVFQKDALVLLKDEKLPLPTPFQIKSLRAHFLRKIPLGTFHKIDCFCAEVDNEITLPEGMELIPLKKAFSKLSMEWFHAATKAYSVINWDRTHQYCGRCGNLTVHKLGAFERTCPQCGLNLYPRISPSIIVLITKGDYLLMARSPHFPKGVYGLIAGFVEVGENIEEAVFREVKEEVGISIKNLQYFGSQPWPFPDSLMIAFTADYADGELVIDHKEIEDAGWYLYDQIPGRPSSTFSIAGQLIDYFIKQQTERVKK